MAGWDTGRPIHDRLPGENEGYRKDEEWGGHDPIENPPIARWLTTPWDELLMEWKTYIDDIPKNYLDPATALPSALDWLGQLWGFTGEYWDTGWPDIIRRTLIQNSQWIWINMGTETLMTWMIALFGLKATLYQLGDFRADISEAEDTIGNDGREFEIFVIVNLADYFRVSAQWRLLERLCDLYMPIYVEKTICYEEFYADFSLADDPIFS
jgi:hypothetical protein